VGRDELLANLYRDFSNGRKVLVLHGQGGIGKTSLAIKLMESCGVNPSNEALPLNCPYDNALYEIISDRSFDMLADTFLDAFGIFLDPNSATSDQKIDMILTALHRERWLIVIDNLETLLKPDSCQAQSPDVGNLLNRLAYGNHNSQIIITSRKLPTDLEDRQGNRLDRSIIYTETIWGLSQSASVTLLKDLGARDNQNDLDWIANRVGGNILLLKLLAIYSRKNPGRLRKEPELVTEEAIPIVRVQLETQTPAAQELLRKMFYFDVGIRSRECLDVLNTIRYLQSNQAAIETTRAAKKETEFLLLGLVNSGLVEEEYDILNCQSLYKLHPLISETFIVLFKDNLSNLSGSSESTYLLMNYYQKPSIKVRNQLVLLNAGLVRQIGYRISRQCAEPYQHLEKIGYLGLIRAIERFNPYQGRAFSSFAIPYIRGEILHFLRDKSSVLKIPRRWQELQKEGEKVHQQLTAKLGRKVRDEEIAAVLNVSVDEWREAQSAEHNRQALALDDTAEQILDSHPDKLDDSTP
jgi:RNA polymerase sigma factor (sigma-70 family)